MLERRFPEEYGRRAENSVKVESEGAVTIYIPDNGRDDSGDSITA